VSHTYAILQVNPATYRDIEERLRAVNYGHCIDGGVIDMHGIALQVDPAGEPEPRPFLRTGAKVYRDGDAWCVTVGPDIQAGVAGFGNTVQEAQDAFDEQWQHWNT
jgi:hypothetical protein